MILIFFAASFMEIRNSLGVIKRQEKELNDFYEDDTEEEELENEQLKKEEDEGNNRIFEGNISS